MNKFIEIMNEIESIHSFQETAVFKLEILIQYLDNNNLHSNDNTSRLLSDIFSSLQNSVQDLDSATSELCTYILENKESEVNYEKRKTA